MLVCANHAEVAEGVRRCARCGTPYCPDCTVDIQGRPYCATCKTEQLLDVRSGVDYTRLDLASVGRRFAALIIDSLLTVMPLYILMLVLMFSTMGADGQPNPYASFIFLPMMFVQLVYEGLMFALKDGQTVGKMAMKVRVVRADGTSMGTGLSWGRAAMKFILSGCLSIIDFIPAFFTAERTTLHDMVCNTRVINTD
jgi:uncharacterized RDD family membrane protein YckC